jgi:hypothetical protein
MVKRNKKSYRVAALVALVSLLLGVIFRLLEALPTNLACKTRLS